MAPDRARRPAAADEEEERRPDGAEGEGPDEGAVEGGRAEEAGGADDAPEDGAVEVDAGERAGEAVAGVGGAEGGEVAEHPVEDADLRQAGDQGGQHLDLEEEARGQLHVVAELEVGGEFDALGGRDVAVGDEDHVCDRAAGEDVAGDELADEVEGRVLVCDGHDYADGDEEEGG